jgi:hypothetical protein
VIQSFLTAPAVQKRVCLASLRIILHHAIIHDCELSQIPALNDSINSGREVHALEETVVELEALLAVDSHDGTVTNGFNDQPQHSLDATRFVGPESGIK